MIFYGKRKAEYKKTPEKSFSGACSVRGEPKPTGQKVSPQGNGGPSRRHP